MSAPPNAVADQLAEALRELKREVDDPDIEVWASNAYRLEGDRPCAPVLTLRRLRAEGVAAVHTPGHAGAYGATKAGRELALILRQQELPPPCGFGGGDERAHA